MHAVGEKAYVFFVKFKTQGLLRVQWVGALRVLVLRMDWHVIMQVSNTVRRSKARLCLGTTALAGNEQIGMHASGSQQGRRGVCMATPADRMHTATGLGARSSNQQRDGGAYALCL